jgi:siroheme synthase
VISTLAELPAAVDRAGLKSPVTIIVGRVVDLSAALDWFGSGEESCDEARDLARA